MRRSGLQTDVLTLYRTLLRTARSKDVEGNGLTNFVKQKFRERSSNINRNEFQVIEHELRYGYKQIKLMKMPGFSAAGFSNR